MGPTSYGEDVCTGPSCTNPASFSGTFGFSGNAGTVYTVQVNAEAEVGFNATGETAFASADPFISVDPAFAGASNYSIIVSPDVSNSLPSVPEPNMWPLVLTLSAFGGMAKRLLSRRA